MDSGKSVENEKLQAMKNQNKGCFLYSNLMLYSVSGFVCSLICYCPYWYCSLSKCSMKDFLFMYVPCIWSSFSSPKCLFIIANVIIVFLVGESNFMGSSGNPSSSSSSSSSPADELYDEYVQRSSRRVRNREAGVGAGAGAASNFPEKIKQKKPQAHLDDQMKMIKQRVKRVHQVKDLIKEKEKKFDDDEEEEAGLPADELNKRAEEFIARVNKQRWLEARSLICCKA